MSKHYCPTCYSELPKPLPTLWFGTNGALHFQDRAIFPSRKETILLKHLLDAQAAGVHSDLLVNLLDVARVETVLRGIRAKLQAADIPVDLVHSRKHVYYINPVYRQDP